ncbi:hypothetical protein Cpa01nite_19310 [Cellulomonas pakistanensis]|uniref:DUF4349 domain-containing protein n=1 Tax=Cellulomonas pakistanensis TaxID=992287 RepID=A0A919U6S3_9CELL|nr:hypothetical protein Cpa01nite_19310 [Cellulomonas pakistanensis]
MTRALGGLALALALLAGCSAGGGATGADQAQGGADQGQSLEEGSGPGGGSGAGDGGSGEAGDAGMAGDLTASGGEVAQDAPAAGDAAGDVASGTGGATADAGGRQVITTGEVGLVHEDPRAAADAVVAEVEGAGGRVDARQETAARGDVGTEATADLTVRVPAPAMTGLLEALDEIGEVDHVDLASDDVTAAAQDLDARIRAMTLSVARMEDLLARATTREEILSAEDTLTERQAALESLQSERGRMAEQVALSTLRVSIWTPPAAEEPAPEEPAAVEDDSPAGFLGGLAAGWSALVTVLGGVVTVLGVLLPWLVLAAAVAWAALRVRRALRRRAADREPAGGGPGGPGGAGGGGGQGDHGPGGPGGDGPGSGGPGGGPAVVPPPGAPGPAERQPVGAGFPRP